MTSVRWIWRRWMSGYYWLPNGDIGLRLFASKDKTKIKTSKPSEEKTEF